MASPPFSLQTTLPGDSDIVSQFPLNERSTRDIIQSWIEVDHDTNGDHLQATFPWQSSTPTTPGASLTRVYASASGRLQIVYPDGSVGFVGNPPGTVLWGTGSIPVGYLQADGSAVSRTTYADLFTIIGTDYGAGNGSTTFNLPNLTGRAIFGVDNSASVMSSTAWGGTPARTSKNSANGLATLQTGNLPPYTPAGSIGGTITIANQQSSAQVGTGGGFTFYGPFANQGTTNSNPSFSLTFSGSAQGGISTPFSTVPPGIILVPLIKV